MVLTHNITSENPDKASIALRMIYQAVEPYDAEHLGHILITSFDFAGNFPGMAEWEEIDRISCAWLASVRMATTRHIRFDIIGRLLHFLFKQVLA